MMTRGMMLATVLIATITVFIACTATSVNATILTFDSIPPTDVWSTSLEYDGYLFTSDHFHTPGNDRNSASYFSYNGTTVIGYEAGRGAPIQMSRIDGGAFDIFSLDAAEFSSSHTSSRPNAQIIDITGYFIDGHSASLQLHLDDIYDGPGGVVDFQHFAFPELFRDVNSLVFTGLLLNGESGGILVDNLEVASVPEPASLFLFTSGLIGLGFFTRRRGQ